MYEVLNGLYALTVFTEGLSATRCFMQPSVMATAIKTAAAMYIFFILC
jgi:hypothetical protein